MTVTTHGYLERMSERVTPARLIDYATREKFSHLWVMAGAIAGQAGETKVKNDHHDYLAYGNKQGLLTSVTGRQQGQGRQNVRVMFRETSAWPGLPVEKSGLAEFIGHMESALDLPMYASPTSEGLRYLEKIDARYYRRYFADPGMDKGQAARLFQQAAKPLICSRVPTAEELAEAHYVVAVDKNATYPRASQENVGIGPAEEYGGPFNHKLPGHWYVSVDGLEKIDPRLPDLLWPGWQGPGGVAGLVTPVVKLLIDFGCKVTVHGAMIWKNTAPVFDRWSTNLWNMRQQWPEGTPENDGFKAIMNNTLGFTINGDTADDVKFRPDWHAQFVGYARALMTYNARSIAQKSSLYPFGCYIDALYYLSPVPYVPGLALAPASLGGYKEKWCMPLDNEIRALLTDPQEHKRFNMLLSKLNQIAERQVA